MARSAIQFQKGLSLPAFQRLGVAHGFLTLSESAGVLYKASCFWSKTCERSLRWDDPQLAISWPLDRLNGDAPLLAEKDAAAPSLAVAAGEVFA